MVPFVALLLSNFIAQSWAGKENSFFNGEICHIFCCQNAQLLLFCQFYDTKTHEPPYFHYFCRLYLFSNDLCFHDFYHLQDYRDIRWLYIPCLAKILKQIPWNLIFRYKKSPKANLTWPLKGQGQLKSILVIRTNIVVLVYRMLHTKFQGHRLTDSGGKDF